jgi:hypothetical protein
MDKRNIKIIKLYIIGLSCVVCYLLLENSDIIKILVEKSKHHRYGGFFTFLLAGLFKYGLLIAGVSIILILSFLLVKEKISKDS